MKCKYYKHLAHPINICKCHGELPDYWTSEEVESIRKVWGLPQEGICDICNKKTDAFAGDPDKWPVELPYKDGNGKKKIYHIGCVVDSIESYTIIQEINREYSDENKEVKEN
jgi:hypothetical protein